MTATDLKPFAGFAPGEHRQLLADVHRWARVNGWATHRDTGWQNPSRLTQVDWEERGLFIGRRTSTDRMWPSPTQYPATSVRQAVDMLVALGILPPRFSSAYGLAERYQEARRAWNLAESHSERIKVGHILDHLRDLAEGVTR